MVLNFFKNIKKKLRKLGKHAPLEKTPENNTGLKGARTPSGKESPSHPPPSRPSRSLRKKRPFDPSKPKPLKVDRSTIEKETDSTWDIGQFVVPISDGKLRFHDLDIPLELMHAVYDLGYQYCTPIQSEILPSTLSGKDATGKAQTGTGKTAAFLISIFATLFKTGPRDPGKKWSGMPRALILAPTRELVMQIVKEAQDISKYGNTHTIGVYGGIDYEKQRRALKGKPVDVLVATPGRLLDFQRQRELNLKHVEILVIDEADRMLDMGFIPDVRKIVYSTPQKSKRQTLFFSATINDDVRRLAFPVDKKPHKNRNRA